MYRGGVFISEVGEVMRRQIGTIVFKILKLVRLSPLSLAEKCRLMFGAAVVLVLALALSIPYVWMGQLTKKVSLDANRARSETLVQRHFQAFGGGEGGLPLLDSSGQVVEPNEREMRWIRFGEGKADEIEVGEAEHKRLIESLKEDESRDDRIVLEESEEGVGSTYVRVFRATDKCIHCHNPQGPAEPFAFGEPIGAVVIESKQAAGETAKIVLMNQVWIIVAGLIGGAGAIVAFYWITQRVILRPIRQLRGLANNVAEGNLKNRSSIKTGDEYEKLARAFNHMLDVQESTQEKLRQANKQLDDKIIELSERNIELFKANKIKGEFLANVSHEFRTPLNAILGFAEIMRDKPGVLKTEKGRKYAENIIVSGKSLLNMINDLLDLAKIEAGKVELRVEQTDVRELCRSVVASFSEITRKGKIKVRLTVDEGVPVLMTDGGKVRQILFNFVSNSVKFTPERGKIEISASMTDEKHVRLAVSDTGCGIAESEKAKIFEKFRQADGSFTRRSTGSGLGLAISKELASMLVGSIGMDSKEGEGAIFWLNIPVALTREEQQKA